MPGGHDGVLVIAETSEGAIRASSRELFGAGRSLVDALGGDLTAVVVGHRLDRAMAEAADLGAGRVLVADAEALVGLPVAAYAAAVDAAIAASRPDVVLLPGTTAGRDVAPFSAAKRRAPYLVDALRLRVDGDDLVADRPVYQGKLLTTVRAKREGLVFVTAHVGAYPAPEPVSGRDVPTESLALGQVEQRVEVLDLIQVSGGSSSLDTAETVVIGGRGLGEGEKFALVEELADVLGGVVGATRAVTDLGWRPHYDQVGQTGKNVSPKLYIGVGVSGAVQHTVGMRGAETVVAINRDPDAPIFKIADFGIIGDLNEVVPALIERLRIERGG